MDYRQFEFRAVKQDEVNETFEIEKICFPPNEACSKEHMSERIAAASDLFLIALDSEHGKIAGFLNGIATNEEKFRDEFFTDASLHDPDGKNVMLLGLDVLPEYRGKGLARELMHHYFVREQIRGRKKLVLTCKESKVGMYEKFGFYDLGLSSSIWGGESWHEMELILTKAD